MDNIKDILSEATEAATGDTIPPELREVAFSKVFDLLVSQRMGTPKADMVPPALVGSTPAAAVSAESPLGKIAARLRVSEASLESVYHPDGNAFDILVPGSRLDAKKAPATKQLALLVCAARQGAELEEWTDADEIRHFSEEFKRYDSANFASAIKELSDVLLIRQSGRKMLVKLSRPGWERAADLVRRLSGEE